MKKAANEIDRLVGANVRLRRTMIGMSQEKLGDRLGITFQQIQKYEKGTNRISASRLQQIAGVLSVTIDALYGGAGSAEPAPGGFAEPSTLYDAGIVTADGLRLMKAFNEISDMRVRRRILDLVQCLVDKPAETAAPASPAIEDTVR